MLKNYINTAVRSLLKQKLYSFINVFGLAIGMAICILVFLYIQEELSYDTWQDNADDIYRVTGLFVDEEEEEWLAITPYPIAQTIHEELPEVVAATKLNKAWSERLFEMNGKQFYSKSYAFVDTSFFQVFSYPFLYGNPKTVLQKPDNIILSEKMAKQYFGNTNPIGQTIQYNNSKEYIVAAVLAQPSAPSHFSFDVYFPWHRKGELRDNEWVSMFNYYTYTKLLPGTDPQVFEGKMNQLIQSKLKAILQKNGVADLESEEAKSYYNGTHFGIQPNKDIHLFSHLDGEIAPNNQIRYLYIYALVAFIMLLIACINFMNIATARSTNRAKEVGVRKVVGASRWQTSLQFLTEAMVQSFVALLLAFLIAEFLLPTFNQMMGKEFAIFKSNSLLLLGSTIGFAIFTGLLAGSYPALFLSGFQPIKVLKGDFSKSKESAPLRKGLVVFQFMVCASLILFLLIVSNQIQFMANKELGFQPEQVLVIPVQTIESKENFDAVRNELLNISGVESISMANRLPGQSMGGNGYSIGDKNGLFDFNRVDENFIDVLDIPLVAGRFFEKKDRLDSINNYVVNESFVQYFGIENDPIGQVVSGGNGTGPIIGVVKDFHWQGFDESINPFVMQEFDAYLPKLAIRIQSQNVQQTIQQVKKKWSFFEPKHPMRYSFLDEDFGSLYKSYEDFSKVLNFITLLIIFTAVLGLFGLAAFIAEQRAKEIGIRKVLGATIQQITYMIVKDFLKLVLIAGIIAMPLGYWIAQHWLQEFAYQTSIGFSPFIASLCLILLIAVLTVSFQAIRASTANPVNAIKSE